MADEELKPCPFCGSGKIDSKKSDSGNERNGYNWEESRSCTACGAQIKTASQEDENGWASDTLERVAARADTAWNTRTPASAPDEGEGGE